MPNAAPKDTQKIDGLLFVFMSKVARNAFKIYDKRKTISENADNIYEMYKKMDVNGKVKSIINQNFVDLAEKHKQTAIKSYIDSSRSNQKWIYMASSHSDCAEDHLAYQGKLYYDKKAPDYIKKYCKNRGMRTIQWVMDKPAWFITRPNCRHFFKAFTLDIVRKYTRKELQRRYKMHRKTGDKSLATPKKVALEEYRDRLKMLEALYSQHPTEKLRREIQKTKLLIKKWEKTL